MTIIFQRAYINEHGTSVTINGCTDDMGPVHFDAGETVKEWDATAAEFAALCQLNGGKVPERQPDRVYGA